MNAMVAQPTGSGTDAFLSAEGPRRAAALLVASGSEPALDEESR